MIINFVKETHTLWHSDCDAEHAPPMQEISAEEKRTLLECTNCGAQGFYPHGRSGKINADQQSESL